MNTTELFESSSSDQWIAASGRLVYEPYRPGATKRADNPWWLSVNVDPGIVEFYKHQVEHNILNPLGLKTAPRIHSPLWGAHISVLAGRDNIRPAYQSNWKKYQNKTIQFHYSPDVEQHWEFFVIPVRCPFLNVVRQELGLNPIKNYHITIGRIESFFRTSLYREKNV